MNKTMTNKKLSDYFSLQRRYSRSINLERDLDNVESLEWLYFN